MPHIKGIVHNPELQEMMSQRTRKVLFKPNFITWSPYPTASIFVYFRSFQASFKPFLEISSPTSPIGGGFLSANSPSSGPLVVLSSINPSPP